jgi:hypothetical protein
MRSGPVVLLVALSLTGCAHTPAPAPASATAVEAHRIKLAVLPVESDAYPRLAAEVNGQLRDAHVDGVDDYFRSKVTLEVVQLSIECVDATAACYSAVGKTLVSDRLLLAQIAALGTPHHRRVRLTVSLFDVVAGAAIRAAERTFKNEQEAVRAVRGLFDETLASPSGAGATARRR